MADAQGSVSVKAGRLTYDAEGDNVRSSMYFSRVIHYPGDSPTALSGVTIGRGYDMGSRTKQKIYADLIGAGISHRQAEAMSMAAGLKGANAAAFVKKNRDIIGEITEQQQIVLFNKIFPLYVKRAKSAYAKKTEHMKEKPDWEALHPAIRDVLIDITYQGFEGKLAMPAATKNDIDYFINFIKTTPEYSKQDKSRGRANYLNKNRKLQ